MAGGIRGKVEKCPRRKECVLTMNMLINLRAIIILFGMILAHLKNDSCVTSKGSFKIKRATRSRLHIVVI
jgi:hypothetical protein